MLEPRAKIRTLPLNHFPIPGKNIVCFRLDVELEQDIKLDEGYLMDR